MPEETQTDTTEEVLDTPQGEEQPEDLSTQKDPAEEPEEDTGEELPEGTKDRTREQFEKLKQHNAQLKAQLEERKSLPSVLDYLAPSVPQVDPGVREQYQQPTPQPQQPPQPELVDEQGYINADALKAQLSSIQEAKQRAEEAERRAREAQERISKYEQDEQTKRLYEQFPELDPTNEIFNRDAYDLVRNELTSQIVNSGTRDAIAAAQKMSRYFRTTENPKAAVQEQRAQATQTAPVTGTQPRQATSDEFEELRRRSRNDPQAVAERLKRLGI